MFVVGKKIVLEFRRSTLLLYIYGSDANIYPKNYIYKRRHVRFLFIFMLQLPDIIQCSVRAHNFHNFLRILLELSDKSFDSDLGYNIE